MAGGHNQNGARASGSSSTPSSTECERLRRWRPTVATNLHVRRERPPHSSTAPRAAPTRSSSWAFVVPCSRWPLPCVWGRPPSWRLRRAPLRDRGGDHYAASGDDVLSLAVVLHLGVGLHRGDPFLVLLSATLLTTRSSSHLLLLRTLPGVLSSAQHICRRRRRLTSRPSTTHVARQRRQRGGGGKGRVRGGG